MNEAQTKHENQAFENWQREKKEALESWRKLLLNEFTNFCFSIR